VCCRCGFVCRYDCLGFQLFLMLGTPVVLLPEGSVPVNSKVVEIINIVKPQAIELIEYANNVRS